jgi:hypothetical protein
LIYSVRLTYAFRSGTLTGVVGNRPIYVFARTTPDHIHAWEKQQEIRAGACTLFDHTFVLPDKSGAPDRGLAQSPLSGRVAAVATSDARSCDAPLYVRRFFVDDGVGGCFIHGWPPCRLARCIVLPHAIEEIVSATGAAGTLTIIS